MSTNELNQKASDLKQLKLMMAELEAEINSLESEFKTYMTDAGLTELILLQVKLTYKDVTSTRVDTAALKKELPEVAARYSKTSTTKRFVIA